MVKGSAPYKRLINVSAGASLSVAGVIEKIEYEFVQSGDCGIMYVRRGGWCLRGMHLASQPRARRNSIQRGAVRQKGKGGVCVCVEGAGGGAG